MATKSSYPSTRFAPLEEIPDYILSLHMGIAKYIQCNDGITAGEITLSVRQSYMTTITLTRKIGTEIHQNVQMSNFVLRVVRDLKSLQ